MTRERWGTFSVIDHSNPSAFVPEVLLYDRLVIPVPYSDSDRERWEREGWDPGLLDRRIKTLGDLAVKEIGEQSPRRDNPNGDRRWWRVRASPRSSMPPALHGKV